MEHKTKINFFSKGWKCEIVGIRQLSLILNGTNMKELNHESKYCLELDEVDKVYSSKPAMDFQRSSIVNLFKALTNHKENRNNKSKDFYAIKGLSLKVSKSESLGIIGLNGSGKSTLMQLIAGTLQPTRGSIIVRGKVAALLELGSGFSPDFTGRENVLINGKIFGLNEREVLSKVTRIREFADIGDYFDKPVSTYSTGMVLRLAFAVITQVHPDILIIDEALAVGDAKFQLKCYSFLKNFKREGGMLIVVSHDLNSIAALTDKVLLLHHGIPKRIGKPINIINYYSKLISNPKSQNQHTKDEIITHDDYDELDYGNKLGFISNERLLNSKNNEQTIFESGENIILSFEVNVKDKIENPIFSMRIRNTHGVEIYGTNTLFAKKRTPHTIEKNNICYISFDLKGNISAGKYLISVGFSTIRNGDISVIHRKRECIEFEIINRDGSFGIANCFCNINVEK